MKNALEGDSIELLEETEAKGHLQHAVVRSERLYQHVRCGER